LIDQELSQSFAGVGLLGSFLLSFKFKMIGQTYSRRVAAP